MSETMLALVALMIAVFFAISQQRGIVESEREIASIELEVLAHAVGSEVMQQIATKPFDAATIGVDPQVVELTDLTLPSGFGDGLACPGACNDIDDFNDMARDTVFFEVGRDSSDNPIGFNFTIQAEVNYVDDAGAETTSRTWTKEVTLFVDQAVVNSEQKFMLQPIALKRQFSPQW